MKMTAPGSRQTRLGRGAHAGPPPGNATGTDVNTMVKGGWVALNQEA